MAMPPPSSSDDHEAEVLLQIQRASIDEITQPAGAPPSVGSRRNVVSGTELLVLSLTFTDEQLADVSKQLNVDPSALAAAPGEPVVVLVCGEYRVPILQRVAARRSSPLNYCFYMPALPIGINLDATTAPEVLEAFEFIVKTYGSLEDAAIPPLTPGTAGAPAAAAPTSTSRDTSAVPLPQPIGGAPPPLHHQQPQQQQQPNSMYGQPPQQPPQQQYSSMYGPPPTQGEYSHHAAPPPSGPPPSYSHQTLEEQQRAAADAAKSNQMYEMPRHRPGSATMVIQTAYNIPQERTATRIAHGIGSLARNVTGLLGQGSDLGARGIRDGAGHVVAHTERTQNPIHVPEAAKGHLRRGRMVSKGAVAVTGGFAATVVGVTSVISDQVSGHLRHHVPAGTQGPEPSTFDDVKEVGVAAVGAAAAVTDAAMDAARTLFSASCDGATSIVTHKLGDDAGQVTQDGLGLVQDGVASASNMRKAGLKSIAKATLKDTAKKTVA